MEIYKAPKVMIFHLKRFRSSNNTIFKKKISTLITFPIENLDLTNVVLNKNLPQEY